MCGVGTGFLKYVLSAGAFFIFCLCPAADSNGQDFTSVQLVGRFGGITCEPDDAANDMEPDGARAWRKLKFINEPGDPDTIFFKFTADRSYLPKHWGWSLQHGWGIAAFDWNPPAIATVLPDSGYWHFCFNDSTFHYRLERPECSIAGVLLSVVAQSVPDAASVTLFSVIDGLVGSFASFTDSLFSFEHLPEGEFYLTASAPGYRDTTVSGIFTSSGECQWFTLQLEPETAVQVTSASCERISGGVLLTWTAYCCGARIGFDVYRSDIPDVATAVRRNAEPVYGVTSFAWFDECGDPLSDRYYWIVEVDSDDPAVIGPILAAGTPGVASSMGQNFPNPFNPATTIPYTIGAEPGAGEVTISFFDVSGRLIAGYNLGLKPAGRHSFLWNPVISSGTGLPSGVYYCRLRIGKDVFTRKMVLLR